MTDRDPIAHHVNALHTAVQQHDGGFELSTDDVLNRESKTVQQVDAGVDNELVFGDPKAPRFVWWEKKLRPTPSGPDALTFDLLTIAGKLRAGLGAVGLKQGAPGDIQIPSSP